MYLPKWNIGLEINSNTITAVALQRKRYGWQLRGWWHTVFEQPLFNQQGLVSSDLLSNHLSQWRKLLPKTFSLRMVLPSHLVLQQPFKLPLQPLSPQELGWYIESSLSKLFPLSANELIIDYRAHTVASQQQLLITATRRNEFDRWLAALKKADLKPDVIDISPCILRHIARDAGVPKDSLLMHRLENEYFFVSPLNDDFYFEPLDQSGLSLIEYSELACVRYAEATHKTVKSVSISGKTDGQSLSKNMLSWSPFSAIQQLQPPIPNLPSLFTISCGLAMREADYDASQSVTVA